MQTNLYQITPDDQPALAEIGALLRAGGLIGIPTETVYGLAANALDGQAVAKIFQAKGRPQDNPLIVHIAAFSQLYPLVGEVPTQAIRLARAYWPGPLTMILPKSPAIPEEVSAGLDTVAVRMPSHPLARAIIQAAGVPLAAPSANLSGSPSPTTAQHVLADMAGRIQAVVDGGPCSVGVESTVVTLASPCPRLLRPGGITPEQLRAVLGKVEIDRAVEEQLAVGEKAASPGMKYKHYAPKAHVVILRGPFQRYAMRGKKPPYMCARSPVAGRETLPLRHSACSMRCVHSTRWVSTPPMRAARKSRAWALLFITGCCVPPRLK